MDWGSACVRSLAPWRYLTTLGRILETPKALGFGGFLHRDREQSGEFGTPHPELSIDVGQVRLDRAHAHEELGGDLLVRTALGGELGDALLRLGQLLFGGPPPADATELRPGLVRPQPCAELVEDRERLLERLAG